MMIAHDPLQTVVGKAIPSILPSSTTSPTTAPFNASPLASLLSSRNLKDFVWSKNERPNIAYNQFECELPLIDLTSIFSGEACKKEECLSQMAQACKDWGMFQVINHGISCDLIQKMEASARRFFKLGLNQKRRVLRGPPLGQPLGYTYGDVGTYLKNDFPWMEALQLPAHPVRLEDYISKIWREGNEEFSAVAKEYNKAMKSLALQLVESLTTQLGLEHNHVTQHLEDGSNSVFRFNYYPPCPQPSLTLGLGAHSDPHVLTILHQDEVGGLQISRDRKWIGVRPKPNALVINVGDVLQVWSNDIYKSVEHRAVCNSKTPRLSMAFFLNPGENTRIAPAQELLDSDKGMHYRPFTWQEYRKSMYKVRLRGKNNLLRFRVQEEQQPIA